MTNRVVVYDQRHSPPFVIKRVIRKTEKGETYVMIGGLAWEARYGLLVGCGKQWYSTLKRVRG